MPAGTVFLSFTRIPDVTNHRAYNTWHQLDHRPENLALSGVRYGERWVHSPRCASAATTAEAELAGLHYLNAYWFDEPAQSHVLAWQRLAEESLDQGRRPDLHLAERLLMGFFEQIQVQVSPALAISAEALPMRPARGIHLSVEEVTHPRSGTAELRNRWDREVRVPGLAKLSGVAGVCLLVSTSTTLDPAAEGAATSSTLLRSPAAERGRLRVLLTFLEEDPIRLAHELDALCRTRADRDPGDGRKLFRGVLQTIVPWEWDWFDEHAEAHT